jgi:hypothetical protein
MHEEEGVLRINRFCQMLHLAGATKGKKEKQKRPPNPL